MRQHLTVEEFKELNNDEILKLATIMYGQKYNVKYEKVMNSNSKTEIELLHGSGITKIIVYTFVKEITIGVLQAILLEAGYDIHMANCNDGEGENWYHLRILYERTSKPALSKIKDEPICGMFEAVKELVLKGVE